MRIRSVAVAAALGLSAVATLGTVPAAASPELTNESLSSYCGRTVDFEAMDGQDTRRGSAHFTVDCRTLAGDITAYTISGTLDDWYDDGYTIRLKVVISGSPQYVWASGAGYSNIDISGSGRGGTINLIAYLA